MNQSAEPIRITSPKAASMHLDRHRSNLGMTGLLVLDHLGHVLLEASMEGGPEAKAPREVFRLALAAGPKAHRVLVFTVADNPAGYCELMRPTAQRLRDAGEGLGLELCDFLVLDPETPHYESFNRMGW